MIEFITISRLLTDYLWEYKALSILHSIASLATALFMLIYFKKNLFKACNADKIVLLFFALTSISFAKSINIGSAVDFLKFATYLSFYFVGRIISPTLKIEKILGLFSIIALLILTSLAAGGKGYTTWGNVETFTGGYYFKTDLALASLIFFAISFVTLQKKTHLVITSVCAAYLIFKSNARIALPLVIIIPIFIRMTLHGKFKKINMKLIFMALTIAVVSMSLFALLDFNSLGMLGFDFSDPFSAANTQGRSVIWAALIQAYSNASITDQLFGMGLDADTRATNLFSQSLHLEGARAHSSYLYLLVCIGLTGSLTFYSLIYSLFSKAPLLFRYGDIETRMITTLSCTFLIFFLWLSMTTEIIVRPQLMVLFFFFSGLHVQKYLRLKRNMRSHERAVATWT